MILSAENLYKSYGEKTILEEIHLKIEDNDRIGLIGINGAGKSTLLKLLTGREEPDSGEIARRSGAAVGMLEQNAGLDKHNTIWQEMMRVFSALTELESRLRQTEKLLASPEVMTDEQRFAALSHDYAVMQENFEKHDGYLIEVKIKTILNGMGFADKSYDMMIDKLSGGEKTRLALAKLLLEEPQLLILDEPTNHLDFKTLRWLESYLTGYKGALLVVSHDRYFLDKIVTTIWEIERHRLSSWRGNYSKYVLLKEEATQRQLKEYEKQQATLASLQDYVDRNMARASTSKSAKGRLKAIERMELIDRPHLTDKRANIRFETDMAPFRDVLTVTGMELAVGSGETRKQLVQDVSLTMHRGERIALIGANGIGKSTFLKAVQGIEKMKKGRVEWSKNVKIGYYEQENRQLHPEKMVLHELWDRFPNCTEQKIRSVLGCVLLTGDNVFKQVGVISGGEKAKLSFAVLMMERANVLILDEPTNHLDLLAKESLEDALLAYDGTILFVSHDRYLLNKIPTHIAELDRDGLHLYEGRYDDYLEVKEREEQQRLETEQQQKLAQAMEQKKTQATVSYKSKAQKSLEAQNRRRFKELEAIIADCEALIAQTEAEMATPEVYGEYLRMQEKCSLLEEEKQKLSGYYDEWYTLSELL